MVVLYYFDSTFLLAGSRRLRQGMLFLEANGFWCQKGFRAFQSDPGFSRSSVMHTSNLSWLRDFSVREKFMKILVVHRQKLVVDQIKSVLIGNSPVVIHTDSGLDGLLTSRIESFDLIICGTDLPVITGFELVRSIRTNSVNKHVPVIFIADHVDAKTEHLGNALGVAGMLNTGEVDDRLADMVQDRVKTEPHKGWQEIILKTGLN
jgi:CheY-like chemotaxis protein